MVQLYQNAPELICKKVIQVQKMKKMRSGQQHQLKNILASIQD